MEFEDEYEDEWEDEEMIEENEDDEDFDEENDQGQQDPNKMKQMKDMVIPFLGNKGDLKEGEVLECSLDAYKMLHQFTSEWPCLSFDFIVDTHDNNSIISRDFKIPNRSFEYPIDMFMVSATQAEKKDQNSLYLMRMASLSKI